MPSLQVAQGQLPSQQQSQAVSLRLQHSVRLLQMSSLDFAQSIADALADNPFLESDPDDDGAGAELPSALLALVDEQPTLAAGEPLHDELGDADDSIEDIDDWQQAATDDEAGQIDEHVPGAGADDWAMDGKGSGESSADGFSAVDLMAQSTSLVAHLRGQLNVLPLPPRDMALAQALVEMLDDDGYLRADPLELTLQRLDDGGSSEDAEGDAGGDDAVAEGADSAAFATAAEVQIALRRVQSLDPAGVAARSVQECLLLQLGDIACSVQRALAHAILQGHLPRLAARDLDGIARALGQPLGAVEAACARIRRLQPRPGWRFGASTAAYVTPDVVVRRVRDGDNKLVWRALLNPAIVPRVRMNRHLVDLYRQHRSGATSGLAGHLQLARWTLKNVEQRFCTIVAVTQAIVDRQRMFLDYGEMAMKPLGLREIADAVGVHESTVSRVTSNKYVATPAGVFELKHFFSRAMVMPGGNACSNTAIRGLLRELIDAEPRHRPLTDVDLAEQLRLQGLRVARRTVTKYRQALRIDAAAARRMA